MTNLEVQLPSAPTVPGAVENFRSFGKDIGHREVPNSERGQGTMNAFIVLILVVLLGVLFFRRGSKESTKQKKKSGGRKDGAVV